MPLAEVLFSPAQIQSRVRELGDELTAKFRGTTPLLVGVLKGSVIFLADLIRALGLDADLEFMSISSYVGTQVRTGVVRIVKDIDVPLEGRDVVVVEDIVDTGLTLSYLVRTLENRGPNSLSVCTLVDKEVRRIVEPRIDHAGFTTDQFVVGYGLDFKGKYRNLPYIAAVGDLVALANQPAALAPLFALPDTPPFAAGQGGG